MYVSHTLPLADLLLRLQHFNFPCDATSLTLEIIWRALSVHLSQPTGSFSSNRCTYKNNITTRAGKTPKAGAAADQAVALPSHSKSLHLYVRAAICGSTQKLKLSKNEKRKVESETEKIFRGVEEACT